MSTVLEVKPPELRLSGRQATLRSSVHTINRHAGRKPLRRVDATASTVAPSPALRRMALALLQRALNQAIAQQLREHADRTVDGVCIDVCNAEVHGALRALLVDDAAAGTRWLLQSLQRAGIAAQQIRLDYRFTPANADEGTATASKSDLVVHLQRSTPLTTGATPAPSCRPAPCRCASTARCCCAPASAAPIRAAPRC